MISWLENIIILVLSHNYSIIKDRNKIKTVSTYVTNLGFDPMRIAKLSRITAGM